MAIDIGHNYINLLATFLDRSIIIEKRLRNIYIDSSTIIEILTTQIDDVINNLPITVKGVIGCAISIHGLTKDNRIIFSPIYDLIDSHLYDSLTTAYSFPFYLENEANLAALGEFTFVSKANDLLCISIHGGIGLGIIENGHLRLGKKEEQEK